MSIRLGCLLAVACCAASTVVASDPSVLRLDIATLRIEAENWAEASTPLPVGSLLKPFAALAYARSFSHRYPEFKCSGQRCWLPDGHGAVSIVPALANSCNAYFRELSYAIDPTQLAEVSAAYGLRAPPEGAKPEWYFGLGPWAQSPRGLLRAYYELWMRRAQPGVGSIVDGMRGAARYGTAHALGAGVLAKTGTAECSHQPRSQRAVLDGFVIRLKPDHAPTEVTLVRLHNATGRQAAEWLAARR